MVGCEVPRENLGLGAKPATPHNSASAAPQNQANCIAQKFAWWAAR